jgi:uroporphyrinogen-III synthase
MPRVLITCTQPRANDIAHDLQSSAMDAIAMPALIVERLYTPIPDKIFDAMIITSVHAMIDRLPDLPVIAIGGETARMAKMHGYNVIDIGVGGINDLDLSSYSNILYPCADEPTTIPLNTTPWIVYQTRKNDAFIIDDSIEIICVFSIKAAQIIKAYNLRTKTILCLSQNIKNALSGVDVAYIASCTHPRYDAMKELTSIYLRKHT